MKRLYLFSATLLVAAALLAPGCNFKAASNEAASNGDPSTQVKVKLTRVTAGDLKLKPVLSMKVYGYETTQLNSKIDGYVERLAVDIGDPFKKKDELAVLFAPELGDEVVRRDHLLTQAGEDEKSARANVRLAMARRDEQHDRLKLHKIKQHRAARLVSQDALNQEKLDEADAAVRATMAAIRSAEADIDAAEAAYNSAVARSAVAAADLEKSKSLASYRSILAPFDGVVIERHVDSGALVSSSGTPLLTVAIQKWVKVVVYLPIDQAAQLDVGDPVVLHDLATMPGVRIEEIDGKRLTISRFSGAVSQQSHLMRAEIDIDNVILMQERNFLMRERDFALTIGDYGKASVTLHDYKGKPTVLSTAVGSNRQGSYVIVVDNKMAREVPVHVLLTKEVKEGDKMVKYTVLESTKGGVQAGDLVVVDDLKSVPRGKTLQFEETK
ncbi:MAG: efflux RND transporter periplasmic adaptor subunit [Planctomycetes bacterium]|nr:efflux RND transporter periplasmic adaptor subunit [Planctomycetota bacterium]